MVAGLVPTDTDREWHLLVCRTSEAVLGIVSFTGSLNHMIWYTVFALYSNLLYSLVQWPR